MLSVETYNYFVALGTVALQILAIVFLAIYILRWRLPEVYAAASAIGRWGLWVGLVVTIVGIVVSLFYSDVLGIPACGWCWIQRIFLYPQAILFALALCKRDRSIADYSIAFSIFGAAAALYQHYLQMGGMSVLPCPATSQQAVDCAVRFLFEFNYITFPLVSFSVFAFLVVLMLYVRKSTRE